MVDTVVDAFALNDVELSGGTWGPYWIDDQIGAIAFISATTFSVWRTTNGGSSWTENAVDSSASARHVAAWFDQETPGDTGTILHLVCLDSVGADGTNEFYYRDFDISDGTFGTRRLIQGGLTVSTFEQTNKTAITKTRSGNLIAAYRTVSGPTSGVERSTDGGVTWDVRTDVFESSADAFVVFFPADTDDDDDAVCLFVHNTDLLTIKMYDETANSWTEFGTNVFSCDNTGGLRRLFDASVRHSDGHIVVAGWNLENNAAADLQVADLTVDNITTPAISNEVDILTNQDDAGGTPGVFINQQNDDVYVGYIKGTAFFATVEMFYQLSTDDLASWDGEVAMSEDGLKDIRSSHAGRTVGDDGGRFQPSWFVDGDFDVLVNETNDVVIAAVEGGAPALPVEVPAAHGAVVLVVPGRMIAG